MLAVRFTNLMISSIQKVKGTVNVCHQIDFVKDRNCFRDWSVCDFFILTCNTRQLFQNIAKHNCSISKDC